MPYCYVVLLTLGVGCANPLPDFQCLWVLLQLAAWAVQVPGSYSWLCYWVLFDMEQVT